MSALAPTNNLGKEQKTRKIILLSVTENMSDVKRLNSHTHGCYFRTLKYLDFMSSVLKVKDGNEMEKILN